MAILGTEVNSLHRQALFEFTNGVDIDSHLAFQEIKVQVAWAKGLEKIGIINSKELQSLLNTFTKAKADLEKGTFQWRKEDEDVHMNIERYVTENCGDLGKKMHLGRSRNDLIATTLRLFVHDTLANIISGLEQLVKNLVSRAEKDIEIIIPGQTHLQNGQPIRLGHVWNCYALAFRRDLKKMQQAQEWALAYMPLGSAALGGTPLNVDLEMMAKELNFQSVSWNAYDAVSDRDYLLEALSAYGQLAIHLSRLSEDVIIWSSSNIGLIKLPPDLSTGSSIMPNKRNPDIAELTRGKSAHLGSQWVNAFGLLKGLPTSYNSDLHELKSVYLKAYQETQKIFTVFPDFIDTLNVNASTAENLLEKGHILATEIADHLTHEGMSFRDAYKQVASLVAEAERHGVQVHNLDESPDLSFEDAVEKRNNFGGTSRSQINWTAQKIKNLL